MKHTFATIGLLIGAMGLSGLNAANIKTLEALSNKTAYVVKRQGNTGGIVGNLNYQADADGIVQASSAASADQPEAQWSIHYSEREKAYFLYNLGAGQFVTGNSQSRAVFTDEAVALTPIFLENAGYWILDCGGYVLGLEKADKGAVIFADDVTKQNYKDTGFCFLIADTPNRELTDEEVNAIEAKVQAGRASSIARYEEFVAKAEAMDEKTSEAGFAGNYALWELKDMLAHAGRYSLSEFEEAYNRAVVSRLPQYGYYRIRNNSRPGAYRSNLVTVAASGQLKSETLKSPSFGDAKNGRVEDLSIFSALPDNGDPWNVRLRADAPGWYVNCGSGNNSKAYAKNDYSEATVFTLETTGDYKRPFRLKFPNAETSYLTVSGGNEVVAWNQLETPMQFWFERVAEIEVTTDVNGYLPLILPANVTLPEGVKAWCVTSVRDGKAYVEEISEGVAAKIPFILQGTPSTKYALQTVGAPVWHPSAMTGSCIAQEAPARQQVVCTPQGITFVAVEAGAVTPGTPYVITDETTPLEVVMGADPESGIEEIDADSAVDLFDIQGRHVSGTPRPGLYINAATRKVVRVK